jgi:hypothetical protein
MHLICHCCQESFKHHNALTNHLKKHNLNSQQHYDLFVKKEGEEICQCGKIKPFRGMIKGYQTHCSSKCSSITSSKKQWSEEKSRGRRKKLSEKMLGNNLSGGRPKGSKNIKPYPFTEKVVIRMKNSRNSNGTNKAYSGKFVPKNPQKYKGDFTNITYRSTWERRVMVWFDERVDVISWSSEEVVIPYKSPADGKYHRYFVDFYVQVKQKDDTIKTLLIEVKPYKQTKEPVKKSRVTKQYITEVVTYGINTAKWAAATEFCADRGWQFKVLTEYDLGIK